MIHGISKVMKMRRKKKDFDEEIYCALHRYLAVTDITQFVSFGAMIMLGK